MRMAVVVVVVRVALPRFVVRVVVIVVTIVIVIVTILMRVVVMRVIFGVRRTGHGREGSPSASGRRHRSTRSGVETSARASRAGQNLAGGGLR
ncbi:hypothetical protein [Polyangium sp. y55x31]|uniref:hypothetical protein n=1 Tax=Polyangium sp. y55x31 TaxID=3042688 RepID=UPI00248269C0|nr:hypothetical protein [Polyangium sp. y55x31]MDI1484066.1 hypothetical protein [Polyangium sp. y55x31]